MALRDLVPGPINFTPKQVVALADAVEERLPVFNVKDFGAKGDGSTDDTEAFQTAIDHLDTNEIHGTIHVPNGEYIIDGPLEDTGASNSQLVLPKRTLAQSQFTMAIEGPRYPSMLGLGVPTAGAIIRSTLGSGSGAMLGVKTSGTLGTSALNLTLRNLTLQMPVNPTNTALDLSYVMQPRRFNMRYTTGQTFNAWTEPTTSTSAAVKMPLINVPSTTYGENEVIDGFFIGIDSGELTRCKNLTIAGCYRAINQHATIHKAKIENGLMINNRHVVYAPDTSPTTFAWIDFDLDIERATTAVHGSVWFVGQDEINDLCDVLGTDIGYLNGPITTHLDLPFGSISDALIVNGGAYVQLNHWRSWTPTFTNLTVGNGTLAALYWKRGRTVFCRLSFVLGSTSSISGDIKFTLPVDREPYAGNAAVTPMGTANAFDTSLGGGCFVGTVDAFSTTLAAVRFHTVSGTVIREAVAASGTPFSWATADELAAQFTYESEW